MWKVTLQIRKNSRSGSAIQKILKETFGNNYQAPGFDPLRTRSLPDHVLECSVMLPWQGDKSDPETTYMKSYVQTLEPLTVAIATALTGIGIKIIASHFDNHAPIVGHRVEIVMFDEDHKITYYTFETEAGKKKVRELNKVKSLRPPGASLADILGEGSDTIPDF